VIAVEASQSGDSWGAEGKGRGREGTGGWSLILNYFPQRRLKFRRKAHFLTFGGRCKKLGGYLDPQIYTTRSFVTDAYYIRKHKLRISHRLRVHMERDFEKKHRNQSPNAFIPSSASHRIFCVELRRQLSTVFRRLPQLVPGPTEIFGLFRILGAQQALKFGEKPQISTFGGPV